MCFKRKRKKEAEVKQPENKLVKYLGRNEDLVWSPAGVESLPKGSQMDIVVPMSREAICAVDGVSQGVWQPGRYTITADEKYTEQDVKVYYINKTAVVPIRWGTSSQIDLQDPVFEMPVRFGANGSLKVGIHNTQTFLFKVVGTKDGIDDEGLANFFRAKTVLLFTSLLGQKMIELGLSYFELPAQLQLMSSVLMNSMHNEFVSYGLDLVDFTIDNIKISEETLANFSADKEMVRRLKVREGLYDKLKSEARTDKADDFDRQIKLIQAMGQAAKDAKYDRDVKIEVHNNTTTTKAE